MLKKIIVAIILATSINTGLLSQSHKIDVTIEGVSDSTLILGYYFNKRIFVHDTCYVNTNGSYTFEADSLLKEGLYIVYLEDQSYFDILIGKDQTFKIHTSKDDLLNNMRISGSDESAAFSSYQKVLIANLKEAQSLQEKIKASDNESEKDALKAQFEGLTSIVNEKYNSTIKDHPNSFLSIFLKATQEIEIPEFIDYENSSNPDSVRQRKQYDYYKTHYFDNFKMDDPRILRTPIFTKKLENYFANTLIQIPDTIIKESHRVIAMANGNYDMEKYLIQHLFNMANESKIMGMDAVIVSLGEAYYLSGRADWVDDEFLQKLRERVYKIKPNLLGTTAADFKMQSYTDEFFRLSEIYADITILAFWEVECGHCEKEIPKLNEDVWKKYSDQDIKIIAVYTQRDKDAWIEFIHNNELDEWIHLYDPMNRSNFRNNYDIYSTPVIYILDKDKKILAKRIAVDQIPGFLDHHFKLK